jgi:hypothetical protein
VCALNFGAKKISELTQDWLGSKKKAVHFESQVGATTVFLAPIMQKKPS